MEDIFTYVIVFGLLILFTTVYLFKKDVKKTFVLSRQQLGGTLFTVFEVKQHKTILSLVLELNRETVPSGFFIELIDAQRQRETVPVERFTKEPVQVSKNGILMDYPDFKAKIEQLQKKKMTFRFGYELGPGTKIKSHELTFSKHWNIYKVDSGRYN